MSVDPSIVIDFPGLLIVVKRRPVAVSGHLTILDLAEESLLECRRIEDAVVLTTVGFEPMFLEPGAELSLGCKVS